MNNGRYGVKQTSLNFNKNGNQSNKLQKSVISVAAAATLGIMANNVEFVQATSINLISKQEMHLHDPDQEADSISKSNADDMFAFSQIIASGGNPLQVAAQMEADSKKEMKVSKGGLDDDQAMSAFAAYMAGDVSGLLDPAVEAAKKAAANKEKKAQKELDELQASDSTAAFAGLVEVEAIEKKAVEYKGSAPDDEDDEPKATKEQIADQKIDALKNKIVSKNKKAKISIKPAAAKSTSTAAAGKGKLKLHMKGAKAEAPKKITQAQIDSGAEITVEETSTSGIGMAKKSSMQDVIDQLNAGKTVDEVRTQQKSGKKLKKPLSIKPKIAQKVEAPVEKDEPPADDANVDAQAEDIINSIKSATANIKNFDGTGDSDEQAKALEGLLGDAGSLKASLGLNIPNANLLQVSSDIKIEPELEMALDYMSSQFPDDFPPDKVEKPKPKLPTEKEVMEKEKKEALDYSQEVLSEATDYQNEVKDKKKQENEANMTTMELAGMTQDKKEKEMINMHKAKQSDWKNADYSKLFLAQTGSSSNSKSNIKSQLDLKQRLMASMKSKVKVESKSKLLLDSEQLNFIDQYMNAATGTGGAEVATGGAEVVAAVNAGAADGFSSSSPDNMALLNSAALVQQGEVQTDSQGTQDMKSYSESIAKAADVVNKESDAYDLNESMSFTALKAQHMAAAKGVLLPTDAEVDAKQEAELKAKEAIVAQAEAANSAAIDSDPVPKKTAEKKPPATSVTQIAAASVAPAVTEEDKEKLKAEQYRADKKSALDQGYTEEQANLYAQQEASAADNAKKVTEEAASKLPAPPSPAAPAQDPIAIVQASVASADGTLSVQDQIKAAQQQQDQLKQAMEKNKESKPVADAAEAAQNESLLAGASPEDLKAAQAAIAAGGQAEAPVAAAAPGSLSQEEKQQQAEAQAAKEAEQIYADQQKEAAAAQTQAAAPVAAPVAAVPQAPAALPAASSSAVATTLAAIKKAKVGTAIAKKSLVMKKALTPAKAPLADKKTALMQQMKKKMLAKKVEAQKLLNAKKAAAIKKPVLKPALKPAAASKMALMMKAIKAKNAVKPAVLPKKVAIKPIIKKPVLAAKPVPVVAPAQVPEPVAATEAVAAPEAVAQTPAPTPTPAPVVAAIQAPVAAPEVESQPAPADPTAQPQAAAETEENPVIADSAKPEVAAAQAPAPVAAAAPAPVDTAPVPVVAAQAPVAPVPVAAAPVVAAAPEPVAIVAAPPAPPAIAVAQKPSPVQKPKMNKKMDKTVVQEVADIHNEEQAPEPETAAAPVQPTFNLAEQKLRAQKYEQDLNNAKDQITKAQGEMKSIDTEVTNFHQKMAKSMHSLLQAFSEGFEAMDSAKKDESSNIQVNEEVNNKRVKKLDKIHSSISNLEQLTSKLKLSFDDEPKDDEADNASDVQTQSELKTEVPKEVVAAATAPPAEAPAVVAPTVQMVAAAQVAAPAPAPAMPVATPQKTTKMVTPPKAALAQTVKKVTTKMVSPAKAPAVAKKLVLKSKSKVLKKAAPKTLVQLSHGSTAKKGLQAKMQSLLTKKTKGAPKAAKPLILAQTSSENKADVENFAKALQSMTSLNGIKQLQETQAQLKELSKQFGFSRTAIKNQKIDSLAQSLGIPVDSNLKRDAPNKLIAHTMASRVINQLNQGKSQESVAKDIKKTKQSLILAQKAFYNKDPEAISLIQTDDKISLDSSDKIYLITDNKTKGDEPPTDPNAIDLDESSEDTNLKANPQESEDMQAMIQADDLYDNSLQK